MPFHSPDSSRGYTVSFHGVSLELHIRKFPWSFPSRLIVLSHLSGIMKPGLNAIMGPTGCGKSSFLDVLAGRKDPQFVSGCVLLGGRQRPASVHRCLCGYVVQDNIAMNTLTVRENIAFSAALRSPTKLTTKERNALISSVIEELGLNAVADRLLGTEYARGLSSGERKRTCIGIELVRSPMVLYLDEPTTGLDSYTAGSVMATLRRLADTGRTIVFSIHQPKYSIYRLFDRITLISGGQMIYHGEAGQAPLDYFCRLGYLIEGYDNPADFFMDVLHGEIRPYTTGVRVTDTEEETYLPPCGEPSRGELLQRFVAEWQKSELSQPCQTYMSELCRSYSAHLSSHTSHRNTSSRNRAIVCPAFRRTFGQTDLCTRTATVPTLAYQKSDPFALECFSCDELLTGSLLHPVTSVLRPSRPDLQILPPNTTQDELHFMHIGLTEDQSLFVPRSSRSTHEGCKENSRLTTNVDCGCPPYGTYPSTYLTQFCFLTHRQCLGMVRDVRSLISHFAVQLVIAFFLGVIYYDLDFSKESGVQNRAGLFFFTCLQLLFINSSMIDSFLKDRVIFRHEISSGAYRISAYLLAKIISEVLPVKAIPALLFLPITYSMAGLRYTTRAFLFWELTLSLLTITASSAAFSVSTMVTDFRVGATLLSMFFVLMMITSGFLINVISLWSWLSWLRYLSIMRFATSVLLINELVGTQFCSTASDITNTSRLAQSLSVSIDPTPSSDRYGSSSNGSHTSCISGEWYLNTQDIDYNSSWAVWQNELGLLAIFILSVANSYLYLRLMKKYK